LINKGFNKILLWFKFLTLTGFRSL